MAPMMFNAAQEEKPRDRTDRPGAARVLVMDDDESVRKLLAHMIGALGYEVETAPEGAQALEMYQAAREQGRPFNLVILDLTVQGGLGGEETMQRLLKMDPETQAVVSSGYSRNPVMTNFVAYGFKAALEKPYRLSELAHLLAEFLAARPA